MPVEPAGRQLGLVADALEARLAVLVLPDVGRQAVVGVHGGDADAPARGQVGGLHEPGVGLVGLQSAHQGQRTGVLGQVQGRLEEIAHHCPGGGDGGGEGHGGQGCDDEQDGRDDRPSQGRPAEVTGGAGAGGPRGRGEGAQVQGLDDVAASLPQGAAGPQGQDADDEQDAQRSGAHGLLTAPADADDGQQDQAQTGQNLTARQNEAGGQRRYDQPGQPRQHRHTTEGAQRHRDGQGVAPHGDCGGQNGLDGREPGADVGQQPRGHQDVHERQGGHARQHRQAQARADQRGQRSDQSPVADGEAADHGGEDRQERDRADGDDPSRQSHLQGGDRRYGRLGAAPGGQEPTGRQRRPGRTRQERSGAGDRPGGPGRLSAVEAARTRRRRRRPGGGRLGRARGGPPRLRGGLGGGRCTGGGAGERRVRGARGDGGGGRRGHSARLRAVGSCSRRSMSTTGIVPAWWRDRPCCPVRRVTATMDRGARPRARARVARSTC